MWVMGRMHDSNQLPLHLFFQFTEALRAYPTVVFSDISLCEGTGRTGFHEFLPATFAMIVVP